MLHYLLFLSYGGMNNNIYRHTYATYPWDSYILFEGIWKEVNCVVITGFMGSSGALVYII